MKRLLFLLSVAAVSAASARAQLVFSTLPTPTANALFSISFVDTNTGFACGSYGTLLKTVDGGSTWTRLSVPVAHHLREVKPIPGSGGQKVIVVGDNNTILKSTDGGSNWTAQSVPFAPGSFVFGIQCLDSLNYMACGGDYGAASGAILKTGDGGASWTSHAVTNTVFLGKIFMLNDHAGFSAGTGGNAASGSIQKTGDGQNFSASINTPGIVTGIWCKSATDLVAVGLGGQILRSVDGGGSWSSGSYNSTDLYGVAFHDAQLGYACGGGPNAIILSTPDGGATWTQESYAGSGTLQALCVVGDKLFIAGDGGKILKATIRTAGTAVGNAPPPASGIVIYPNPVRGRLRLLNQGRLSGLRFQLLDMTGAVVADQDISVAGCELETVFPEGCYTYLIRQAGVKIAAGTLLVQ